MSFIVGLDLKRESVVLMLPIYNSELFEVCRDPASGLSSIGFADDLNILAYRLSTEANYKILERTHRKCLE